MRYPMPISCFSGRFSCGERIRGMERASSAQASGFGREKCPEKCFEHFPDRAPDSGDLPSERPPPNLSVDGDEPSKAPAIRVARTEGRGRGEGKESGRRKEGLVSRFSHLGAMQQV
jgi:hypothetical protein